MKTLMIILALGMASTAALGQSVQVYCQGPSGLVTLQSGSCSPGTVLIGIKDSE